MLNAESARIKAPRGVGFLGGVSPLHPLSSQLGDLGERRELPQRGPGRSPGRQRILGIFQGLRILLVETMHYGTNQKFGGPVPPGPSLKPPLGMSAIVINHHQNHQNAWAPEARIVPISFVFRREYPRPTAKVSFSWRVRSHHQTALNVSVVFSSLTEAVSRYGKHRQYAHSNASLAETPMSSRATRPKRPSRRQEMMSPMEDTTVRLMTSWLETWYPISPNR